MHTFYQPNTNTSAPKGSLMQIPPTIASPADESDDQRKRLMQYSHFSAPVHALLALDAGRMGSWSLDVVTGEVVGDRLVANLLGFDYDAQPWPVAQFFSSVHPDDVEHVQQAVDRAFAGETAYYDTTFRANHGGAQNADIWLGARGQVTERGEDGEPLRVVGVNWDATEQKTQEQKLAMLAAEMDHRIKNAFAVILALVKLGDKLTHDKTEFATKLLAQVEAMSTAHALSARMARTTKNADSPLSILEILEASLAPWLDHSFDGPQRVTITCDPKMMIPPRKVSPLAMALYEVSTNATKHGALAGPDGTVEIVVSQTSDDMAQLVWTETSVDVDEKLEDGFGAVLLQHCAQILGGTATQTPTDDRFQTILTMDLTD